MQFDYISDTHLDFWSKVPKLGFEPSKMLPPIPSKVLIIAGDLGHSNDENIDFLIKMRAYYEHIILVFGNHDLYMIREDYKKFGKNSRARLEDMMLRARQIPGVHYLDGDTITIDDVTYGGTGMWYDGKYAEEKCGFSSMRVMFLWLQWSDKKLTYGLPAMKLFFEQEFDKMDKIADKCDVIISHVGPDWSNVSPKFAADPCTGFFYFDGSQILQRCSGKVWVFGHTHDEMDFMSSGCQMLCHPMGYPFERTVIPKIKTFSRGVV